MPLTGLATRADVYSDRHAHNFSRPISEIARAHLSCPNFTTNRKEHKQTLLSLRKNRPVLPLTAGEFNVMVEFHPAALDSDG
ncbi:MAG: hypothetical protein ACI9HK_002054 [Pirellulaceae bacterium]|jgi:hypothetical protein